MDHVHYKVSKEGTKGEIGTISISEPYQTIDIEKQNAYQAVSAFHPETSPYQALDVYQN